MDDTTLWIMEIIGPAILLIVLIWLVMRRRSKGTTGQRRRDGTDNL